MNTQTENVELTNLADIDTALAELDLESAEIAALPETEVVEEVLEEIGDEVVEEIVEEGSTEVTAADGALADDLLKDLDLGLEMAEAYADQTSADADPVGNKAAAAAKKAAAPKERKAKVKKADGTATVRTPRDVSTVAPEFFALVEPDAGADLEAIKTATIALKPTQVKIAEKFDNLFTALSVNKAPSTYVMIAFALLDEKKSVTSADVVAAYKASGLVEGTARSQSGQIMHLFATVGIAERSSQVLTLKADSKIAERLRALPK